MRIGLVLGITGHLVQPFCLAYALPALLALRDGLFTPDWEHRVDRTELVEALNFSLTLASVYMLGSILSRGVERADVVRRSEALAVVVVTWGLVALFGGMPYVLAGMSLVDALFESVSGFTTTGATVLTDWNHSRAFFLWRAMSQWFGGLGVIALFVVVLPRLGIAGRQIFFAESSSAPGEAVSPSVRKSARRLWIFYTGLTGLQATLLSTVGGMPLYDGVVHAFTTLAAGGFSPNPSSVAGYQSVAAEWIITPFMFIAGASFPLLLLAVTRRPFALWRDGEFRLYAGVTAGSSLLIAALLAGGIPGESELRRASFQVASLISSTGYASVDYERDALWTPGIKALLVVVMILGGCAGSAAGGAKQVRFLLVFRFLHRELKRVLHPRAVLPLRHGGEPVEDRVMWSVFSLVLLYLMGYVVLAIPVVLLGTREGAGGAAGAVDLSTGFSASIACLSNVGPGFGIAGPMDSYADFHWLSKLLLAGGMFVGRLEIVTVLALFHPDVWRRVTWGQAPGSG